MLWNGLAMDDGLEPATVKHANIDGNHRVVVFAVSLESSQYCHRLRSRLLFLIVFLDRGGTISLLSVTFFVELFVSKADPR